MIAGPTIRKAAGILFLTPGKKALFLKRGDGGDMPGTWCWPGGTTEGDETPEQTAIRETLEEAGKKVALKDLVPHTRSISPGQVDFTTFVVHVADEFTPALCDEHTGYAWASLDQPPEPLHPGCYIAIQKFTLDELGIARAMSAGHLTSPQRYRNVSLFDMRITGTGVAYRGAKHDTKGNVTTPEEFVYRRPENYLTDDFIARCNGLPVIMMHPTKSMLNSTEFGARIVGTMLLPYIRGDEVWGIAKVYDDAAIDIMLSKQMSTSPAVLLKEGNYMMKTEDGTPILIEGKPSLLDHLAICERGVWDKGGEPSGVRTDNQQGEIAMPFTKEDKEELGTLFGDMLKTAVPVIVKAALADSTALATGVVRADDAAGSKLDKVLSAMDAMLTRMDEHGKRMDTVTARMDAEEKDKDEKSKADRFGARKDSESDEDYKKRMDSDEEAEKKDAMAGGADEKSACDKARGRRDSAEAKAKADAEEKAKEKEKADAAARVSGTTEIERLVGATTKIAERLIGVEKALPKQLTDGERHEFAKVQARADEVYQGFGQRAPYPLNGEDLLGYRRRITAELKVHSPAWKDVDVVAIADANTLKVAEDTIFKDAAHAALHPIDLKENELREVVRQDSTTGVRTIEFRGNHSFVRSMKRTSARVTRIGAPPAAYV